MDVLKLNQKAKDEIQPLISELLGHLRKIRGMQPSFEGIVKMDIWLNKFSRLAAYDEISEEEARQLIFDLETSYAAFHAFLTHK